MKPLLARPPLAAPLLLLFALSAEAADNVHVAAAASLTDAMDEAIAAFEADHDITVTPVYASSSTLARQIANASPAQVFLSANVEWMDWLEEQGIGLTERRDLLHNRLALVTGNENPAAFTPGEDGTIDTLLADSERLSVGDPDHVPAGIYTRQALEALGEWEALAPRLARGSDVRAALALVEREEAPVGVVYQTDALASPRVHTLGLFPADTHEPITYPVALIGADDASKDATAAQTLRTWLESDEALAIFGEYGFATDTDMP
ncbi:molybdate ABC transporter substrate-binding protein [Vreelandella sp. EE7]